MDRIKRLSMEILAENRDKFGTDFVENKKILDEISIVRSKGLKNELAGFITKFIKREIREQEEQKAKESQMQNESESTEEHSVNTETIETSESDNISPKATEEPNN